MGVTVEVFRVDLTHQDAHIHVAANWKRVLEEGGVPIDGAQYPAGDTQVLTYFGWYISAASDAPPMHDLGLVPEEMDRLSEGLAGDEQPEEKG